MEVPVFPTTIFFAKLLIRDFVIQKALLVPSVVDEAMAKVLSVSSYPSVHSLELEPSVMNESPAPPAPIRVVVAEESNQKGAVAVAVFPITKSVPNFCV